MNTEIEVLFILDEILNLNGRSAKFSTNTPLLGAVPELDSMAVIALMARIEEHFGFTMNDDEIDGSVFSTVGSLVDFIVGKLASS